MTCVVTLTFSSLDEALAALLPLRERVAVTIDTTSKDTAGAPVTPSTPSGAANPSSVAPAITRTRKPRSDAGQPRGPYKAREDDTRELTPEELKAIADARSQKEDDEARQKLQDQRNATSSAVPKETTIVAEGQSVPPASVAAEPSKELTLDDARAALKRVSDTKGLAAPGCFALLAEFGTDRITALIPKDMPPAEAQKRYAAFIAAADAKVAAQKKIAEVV
jgi:hypothetical protein